MQVMQVMQVGTQTAKTQQVNRMQDPLQPQTHPSYWHHRPKDRLSTSLRAFLVTWTPSRTAWAPRRKLITTRTTNRIHPEWSKWKVFRAKRKPHHSRKKGVGMVVTIMMLLATCNSCM